MGLSILVVDDSAVMRMMISRGLRQAGFEVTKTVEASNGEEALAKFVPGEIDIVFSDLNMPTMDGLELAKRLRKLSPRVPILLITAEGSAAKMEEAKACGVSDFLRKPPTAVDLKLKVGPLLGPG